MASLRLLVDSEKLAIDFLKTQQEIIDLVATRVGSKIPSNPTYPLLVIRRLGGAQLVANHLDRARLQIDAWGSSADDKGGARLLAVTVQALFLQRMVRQHTLGVVTKVEELVGPNWQPDPTTSRARYVLEYAIESHPSSTAPSSQ